MALPRRLDAREILCFNQEIGLSKSFVVDDEHQCFHSDRILLALRWSTTLQ